MAVPGGALDRCSRCEGWRFVSCLEDGICSLCLREVAHLSTIASDLPEDTMPISVKMYYDFMMFHFEKELKAKARRSTLVLAPFSVEAMHSLREYMLLRNPALYFPPPRQVKGARGGTRIVWQMVVEDEGHFASAMLDPERDRMYKGTSGELREEDQAYVCWVPPLIFNLTMSRAGGRMLGKCLVSSGSARMTALGFSFAPRTPLALLARLQKFMSLAAFSIQQERADENASRQATGDSSLPLVSMLPHALLQMAIRHA